MVSKTLLVGCVFVVMLFVGPSWGASGGRLWMPVDRFVHADHGFMIPRRFEPTGTARLEVLVEGFGGTHEHRIYGFVWKDSLWAPRWHMDREADLLLPCHTDDSLQMLVWRDVAGVTPGITRRGRLYTAEVRDTGVTASDSVGTVSDIGYFQMGAQRGSGRWVVSSDIDAALGRFDYHPVFYARTRGGQWNKLRVPEISSPPGAGFEQVLGLTDTTALALYTTVEHLSWGVINDTGWVRAPERLVGGFPDDILYLRPNPDGSAFLRYGTHDTVTFMRRFDGERWSLEDTLRWAFPPESRPFGYLTYVGPMTLDDRPLPAMLGMAYSDRNALERLYVNIPTESGYGRFQLIPDSEGGFPTAIARDENGDVWVAWWKFVDGMFWTHTYTTAIAGDPVLTAEAGRPRISWELSEPAPESYWGIIRSVDDAPESLVARVVAGASTRMAWTDSTLSPQARATYRVRRECRDVRYRQISAATTEWLPRTPRLGLLLRSPNPSTSSLGMTIEGASAGALRISAYDLQGRLIATSHGLASGTGQDNVQLVWPSGLDPGVYLVSGRSSDGATTRPRKVVVLR